MDNLFIIEEEYLNCSIDAKILLEVMKQYCNRNLDRYIIVKNLDHKIDAGRYKMVPVGTIGFVREFLNRTYGSEKMTPLEVPKELRHLLYREYDIQYGKDIDPEKLKGYHFIKRADRLKTWDNHLYYGFDISDKIVNDALYVVSEWVEFTSEYRVFVMDDRVISCNLYMGNPLVFPDSGYIQRIVDEYSKIDHPAAYTLDIGIFRDNINEYTDLIEIHPFVSCGSYGFQEEEILKMLRKGFDWYVNKLEG